MGCVEAGLEHMNYIYVLFILIVFILYLILYINEKYYTHIFLRSHIYTTRQCICVINLIFNDLV